MGFDSASPSEFEAMQRRYLDNLKHLEEIDVSALYPPEMRQRTWKRVTDDAEVKAFMSRVRLWDQPPGGKYGLGDIMAVFKSEDGLVFAAPSLPDNPHLRHLLLDMLATMRDLAPWTSVVGIKHSDDFDTFDTKRPALWTFSINWIVYFPGVIRNIVNGLGDEKYLLQEKRGYIIEDVAALIHEGVHINNGQDLDWGGPHRVLVELAPITSEFLAFPGRNKKMSLLFESALLLLREGRSDGSPYCEGLLLGAVVLAQHDGFIGSNDTQEDIARGIEVWKTSIEQMDRVALDAKRREYERILLSDNDSLVQQQLVALADKYPNTLGSLTLVRLLRELTTTSS